MGRTGDKILAIDWKKLWTEQQGIEAYKYLCFFQVNLQTHSWRN